MYDPYGPSSNQQAYGYGTHETPAPPSHPYDPHAAPAHTLDRQFTASPVAHTSNGYASSSTSATSDSRNQRPPVPVASFGFNGRLVTFFPSASQSSYSTPAASYGLPYGDNGASSSSGYTATIRKVADLLPIDAAALEAFPGPLFMDSTATTAAGKTKKKKEVVAWLDARIEDAEKEGGFMGVTASPGHQDPRKRAAEEKSILLKLVKLLLENDGKLFGTAKLDEAVRAILVPTSSAFSSAQLPTGADLRKDSFVSTSGSGGSSAVTASAQPAHLDAIQACLLRGDKREAVRYALDNKLWAHALVVSAGVDRELQASVTKEFIQAELAGQAEGAGKGREPLKVAYSLLSGAGASASESFSCRWIIGNSPR